MNTVLSKVILVPILILLISSCNSAQYEVRFSVDMRSAGEFEQVGIRGSVKPLSWKKDIALTDPDGDGIYEATVMITDNKYYLRYKFLKDGEYELKGGDNRSLRIQDGVTTAERVYDVFHYLSTDELGELTYTQEQIDEDVDVLQKTIKYIHPNLYKYQDEAGFELSLKAMKSEMYANPTLPGLYAAVSKFGASIDCSHTFTNPWNQTFLTEQAIFYQPDRLPFTFERVGKRVFVDRNLSDNQAVKKSLEVLSINGDDMDEILAELTNYIAADGDNYEKKLDRLTLHGDAKFELFDIFFALVYGSQSSYDLELYDHDSRDTISTSVNAMSSSERTALLYKKYDDFGADFASSWNFEILENATAHLKMGSFAIFNTDFKWKKFIDDAFKQIRNNNIQHLILDIRDNEGGETLVAEYILEYIIKKKVTVHDVTSVTAYRKISEDIRKHISTWDKRPYDWGKKVDEIEDGRYMLKSKYGDGGDTYTPKKNGFKGDVYLLTNATNSSATHIMATYAKLYGFATIVGEPTGGNQKGLNGGYIFFHKLPNSKVEIDIPVFGINITPDTEDTYNGGIQPDILVRKRIEDVLTGSDVILERTLDIIAN